MAGNSTISITFKLDGDGKGFKQLANEADGLKRAISATVSEAKQLNAEAINFAAVATGLQAVSQGCDKLRDGMKDLADAYAVQETAETRLAVVMQQRMAATAAEIQGIKDLASAQQELGIIGDEVQLSGAQQVATFLNEVDSLHTLIPAMNNLLAQQKGLNATTQDAVNIGNLMGKVMQGQVAALTRVGITFTDAEAKVLKYGTESERAAMLAQVITNNVGEMNAALAKTDSGQQKQLDNTLGDIKEKLGDMVNEALPLVTIASSALSALVNVGLLAMGIQKLIPYIKALQLRSKLAAVATRLMGVDARRTAVTMRVFAGATRSGAYAVTALKLAIKGLMIATGIGIIIAAITTVIEKLTVASEEAADKEKQLAEELREFKRELRNIETEAASLAQKEVAAIDKLVAIAKDETKARTERADAIRELQSKYPAYFSNIDAEAIKVKDLTTDYDKLRDAIIQSAKAKAAQKKIEENTGRLIDTEMAIAAKEKEIKGYEDGYADAVRSRDAGYEKSRSASTSSQGSFGGLLLQAAATAEPVHPVTEGNMQAQSATREMAAYTEKISQGNTELQKLRDEAAEINAANQDLADIIASTPSIEIGSNVRTSTPPKTTEPIWKENAVTLKEITDNIDILEKQLQNATVEEAAAINTQIEAWEGKAEAIRNAGRATQDVAKDLSKLPINDKAKTLEEIRHNIEILNAKLQKATADEAANINKSIELWTNKAEAITNAGKAVGKLERASDPINEKAATLAEIEDNIEILAAQLQKAGIAEAAQINQSIAAWQAKADAIRNAGKEAEKTGKSVGDNLVAGWGAIKGMTSSIETMVDAIKNGVNAWQIICTSIDTVVGLYQGVKSIIEVVQAFAAISAAHAAAKAVETTTETTAASARAASAATTVAASATTVAANKVESASFRELAASEYMAAHAAIPFAGFAIGAGFTASMLATVAAAGIPMLAEGGIASGPTLAMVGEYAGASGNPEVIAPLDKLRRIIEPAGFGGGEVELKIKGRSLVGLLTKEIKHRNRG